MKTQAIRISAHGGPEVMQYVEVEVPDPGPDEVRVRHRAIGVNFIDIYYRTGLYASALPHGLGFEGAGVVEAVGSNVGFLKEGDRVAYPQGPLGAYAQVRTLPAATVVKLPRRVSDEDAAAVMLKGLTVQYLFRQTYRLQGGETILFHAAAGGVGLIACQWLKALGCTVIGTVGSDDKAALARAHGCDHTIVYTRENFAERVKEITGGAKVPVVYDSVGKDTFMGSLDCLQPLGMLAVFGNGSGPVPPFDLGLLAQKGSLFLTRPTLVTYTAKRADLVAMANELFEVVQSGKVKIEVRQSLALADAARAHTDLEARKTTGSTVLLP